MHFFANVSCSPYCSLIFQWERNFCQTTTSNKIENACSINVELHGTLRVCGGTNGAVINLNRRNKR